MMGTAAADTDLASNPYGRVQSRVRSPFGSSEMLVDTLRASEAEVKSAAYESIDDNSRLVNPLDLDKWDRRPSGALLVGSAKPLLSRLIRGGESIRDLAAGAVRNAIGSLSYLNLSQLMAIRRNLEAAAVDLDRSPELRDFSTCLEEAASERLIHNLLSDSAIYYVKRDDNLEVESFSNLERKFLGRRMLLHLGCLRFRQMRRAHLCTNQGPDAIPEISEWFLFCGAKIPETVDTLRGLYFIYPSLEVSLKRSEPLEHVYCLGEVRDSDSLSNTSLSAKNHHLAWHLLVCPPTLSIIELVRYSLSFRQGPTFEAHGQARYRQTPLSDRSGTLKSRTSLTLDQTTTADIDTDRSPLETPLDKVSTKAADTPEKEELSTPHSEGRESAPSQPADVPPAFPLSPVGENLDDSSLATILSAVPPLDVPSGEVHLEGDAEVAGVEDAEEVGAAEDGGEGEELAEVAGGEEEVWGGPVEYDEAVPTYYDIWQESYYYYGNVLYYDPDTSAYYYYDWEQESYIYIDEETQNQINVGAIPVWNQEDGQYYDASAWVEEGAEDEQGGEAEAEAEVAAEASTSPEETESTEPTTPAEPTSTPLEIAAAKEATALEAPTAPTEGPTAPECLTASRHVEPAATEGEYGGDVQVDTVEGLDTVGDGVKTKLLRQDSILVERVQKQPSITRVTARDAIGRPRKGPDRFAGSIDQFSSSESMLSKRALKEIICLFDGNLGLLEEFQKRPNGQYRVGRNRRAIAGLIKGTMELKALSATECADVASSLPLLNLPQLLYIRKNAQNSAWDKSPQAALKTFAMKTDSLVAEKLVVYLLERQQVGTEELDSLNQLSPAQCRYMGSQAIFVVGAITELKTSRVQILGADYVAESTPTPAPSWWFLSSSPTGTATVPRTVCEGPPRGLFFQYPDIKATFKRNPDLQVVYKLVAGRQTAGFLNWDVVEIVL